MSKEKLIEQRENTLNEIKELKSKLKQLKKQVKNIDNKLFKEEWGLVCFVRENTWTRDPSNYGWGNGYVAIPKGHPCYGMDYDKINSRYEFEVHWGLTFSSFADEKYNDELFSIGMPKGLEGMYIIGFDTLHCDSNELFPTKESVMKETVELANQLATHNKENRSDK